MMHFPGWLYSDTAVIANDFNEYVVINFPDVRKSTSGIFMFRSVCNRSLSLISFHYGAVRLPVLLQPAA